MGFVFGVRYSCVGGALLRRNTMREEMRRVRLTRFDSDVATRRLHALPQAILSTWNFDAKFTLLTAQAALSLAFCIIVMEFWPEMAADLHLRPFDKKVMRK